MSMINFKTKSIMKNFKRALKASNHIQDGEIVYFTFGSFNKTIFPRNNVVTKYIDLIIVEMFENQIIHDNFSKEFLKENIIFMLEDLQLNNALNLNKSDFKILFEKLIAPFEEKINEKIKNEFKEFECIFHVSNLKLSDEITLGKVTFFPFSRKNDKYCKVNDNLIGSNFFKEDEVYAKTKIFGLKEYVLNQSQVEIKIAINALKLLVREENCNFNLDGDVFIPQCKPHVLLESNEVHSAGWRNQNLIFGCDFSKDVGDINYELYVLSFLLGKSQKSDFENRLLTAIYWFGEALSVKRNQHSKIEKKHDNSLNNLEFFDVYPKLLNLVICLETLFVYGSEDISEAISSKVSNLIANPGAQHNIKSFLNTIYDTRSKVVHAGNIYVSKKDINILVDYTRFALFYVISINYKYSDKIHYFEKLYLI